MLVILFLTYLPEERYELGTYKIESEVVPEKMPKLYRLTLNYREVELSTIFATRAMRETPTLA
jgi:hypothetical protein